MAAKEIARFLTELTELETEFSCAGQEGTLCESGRP
jgi:hypothetical protein